MTIFRTAPVLCALALAAGAAPLPAQELSYRAGAGIAFPLGAVSERRQAGPSAAVSVQAPMGGLWSLRLEGDVSMLRGRAALPDRPHSATSPLWAMGATMSGVRRVGGGDHGPYLLVGLGGYRLRIENESPSPYGITGALQAGLGVEGGGRGGLIPFAEARTVVHATDYGASDFRLTMHLPVVVGVRLR